MKIKYKDFEFIKESPFGNTYGSLCLHRCGQKKYLQMQDCFSEQYFGPLTVKEIKAFEVLCNVKEII